MTDGEPQPFDERFDILEDQIREQLNSEGAHMKGETFGPTHDYPRGKLNADDEGGLRMGVAHDDKGNVHVNFGTEVQWFAMPQDIAIDFAKTILMHAGAKKVEVEL